MNSGLILMELHSVSLIFTRLGMRLIQIVRCRSLIKKFSQLWRGSLEIKEIRMLLKGSLGKISMITAPILMIWIYTIIKIIRSSWITSTSARKIRIINTPTLLPSLPELLSLMHNLGNNLKRMVALSAKFLFRASI